MLTRRSCLIGAGVLTSGCASAPQAVTVEPDGEIYPREGHPGRRITIRGKRLYIEDAGPRNAPVVVYVHGGPSAGSYPFELYHRERIGAHLRLIVFDQRGALRSEAVGETEPFVLDDLVHDLDALRDALGIRTWTPICHSFAGLVGVRYALAHPTALEGIIFDNPTFDIAASDRAMLEMLAQGYERAANLERATEVRAIAAQPMSPRETWQAFARAGRDLGVARRLDLYAHNLPNGYFFQWMRDSGLPEANWLRGSGPSQETLWRDEACFENLTARLHELHMPALLFKGRYDFNTSQDQFDAFLIGANRQTILFEDSAHLPFAEEPDRYAESVRQFVGR